MGIIDCAPITNPSTPSLNIQLLLNSPSVITIPRQQSASRSRLCRDQQVTIDESVVCKTSFIIAVTS